MKKAKILYSAANVLHFEGERELSKAVGELAEKVLQEEIKKIRLSGVPYFQQRILEGMEAN